MCGMLPCLFHILSNEKNDAMMIYRQFFLTALVALLAALFTACGKDAHENEYPLPEGQGALIVGLEEPGGTMVGDLTLYLFGSDGTTALRKSYDSPRTLADEYIPVDVGSYTLAVVANVENDALPQETTVADLTEWLKAHAGDYPGLLTASAQTEVIPGDIHRLTLELKDGTSGINLATVTLRLTLPDKTMPDHPADRSAGGESKPLRCVAEVWQTGTDNCVHHRTLLCTSQTDGAYLAELFLMPGDYDLRLWTDWNGGYYNADDLSAVTVLTDSYEADGETDKKDAFYAAETLTVTDDMPEKRVTLTRPFARYRLVAADVEAYHNLIKNGENLPAIEDLQVRVTYEGFFPTGFNVATGKPNDALNTSIHYTSVPTVAEGYDEATARQVGADFVLTDGEESAVTVTIQMIDTNTDDTVCTVSGIKIPYKRGHLTTVSGHFLTAGKTAGGVQVDTEWNDEIINF